MEKNCQSERRCDRPGWRSLRQLSDLWGLSRARTGMVVDGLVRSGRMEVRPAPCDCRGRQGRREYRPARLR